MTVLCVGAAIAFGSALSIPHDDALPRSWPSLTQTGCVLGLTYGLVAGLCWLATALTNPILRLVTRIVMVALGAMLLSYFRTADWIRYAINLAGLVTVQSIYFAWWSVPSWRLASTPPSVTGISRRQFQIADLIAVTTAMACLLGLAIRYAAPAPAPIYWIVLVVVWFATPGIATCFACASLADSTGKQSTGKQSTGKQSTGKRLTGSTSIRLAPASLVMSLAGIGLIAVLAIGLTIAEGIVAQPSLTREPPLTPWQRLNFFSPLFLLYGVTMLVFGLAGRLSSTSDHSPQDNEQADSRC